MVAYRYGYHGHAPHGYRWNLRGGHVTYRYMYPQVEVKLIEAENNNVAWLLLGAAFLYLLTRK